MIVLLVALLLTQDPPLEPVKTEHVQGYLSELRCATPAICVRQAALHYGVSPSRLACLAHRESTTNPYADNGRYHGLFQFDYTTWALTPYSNQSIYNAEASAFAAAYLISRGDSDRWPPWRYC